jgi:two-component system NarL family response regulator
MPAPPLNQTRVLIADDHPIVREGLAAMIDRRPDMKVVAQAGTGREAIAQYRIHRPDVALMDLRLPDLDGVQAIEAIRTDFPNARILVITTFDGDEDIHRALHAGASGYLMKDAPREHLMEAIRVVAAGQTCVPQRVAAKLAERESVPEISGREREVLRLIAQGKSNQEIAVALTITAGTVKAHVNNILTKLNVRDRTQAVTQALKRGILHLE